MARRKENDKPIVKDDPSRILDTTMEEVMHNSMMPYAEHVILERALPRVEDGLKPVQRRILYTMMELGVTPDKPHRKCARIVGDCLGKYHPHGDSSVYGAMVHMAQDFNMRGTLVDGHGNFGSIDGDSAAAMRYTEARMTPLSMQMLRDIEKDTVPFRLNFDDTLKEPDMLPARFPNLLVNGANGIAVGLATNIPPHNLSESIHAVIAQIDNPGISLDELMKVMPGPDFPTGGVLIDNEEIRRGYETGRGKLTLRARVHVEDGSAGRKLLVITEVPYQINKAAMLEKILKLSEEKKAALGGIYDIRDESDRTGMRAVIELKKEVDPRKVLAYLYKYSDLQVTFGVNMVAIAEGKPLQMDLKTMIGYFIRHQKNVVTRRTEFELKQAQARAHILEGLMIALDNLDEVIALIRASRSPKDAKGALMTRFGLTDIQAQAILDMRLQRLTNLEIESLRKEFADLLKLISKLQGILGSEKKLMNVIRKELEEIESEYRDDRRTSIEKAEPTSEEVLSNTPLPEDAVLIYTEGGFLKRLNPAALRKTPQTQEEAEDSARWTMTTRTDENLYIFTDKCSCYTVPVSFLNEIRPRDRGQQLTGILANLEDGEKALYMFCGKPEGMASGPDLLFVTEQGMIKRSNASEYDVRSRKFNATVLKKEDKLIGVMPDQGGDLLMVTRSGMAIRFDSGSVPAQGRMSMGVKGIQTDDGDPVVWCFQLAEDSEIIAFSDRGYGKRMPQMEFEAQNRGGKGMRLFPFNKTGTTGRFVSAVLLAGPEERTVCVHQLKSPETRLKKSEMMLMRKADKGFPYILAILDDVVTRAFLMPDGSAGDE